MRYRLRTLVLLQILICSPCILYSGIESLLYVNRPMFSEHFGRHEFSLWKSWTPPFLNFRMDMRGVNAIKIDKPLNVIVVFRDFPRLRDSLWRSDFVKSFRPSSRETFNDMTATTPEGVEFVIPRRANRLFVFSRDGTRIETELAAGKAEECYDAIYGSELPDDLLDTLKSSGVAVSTK